MPSVPSQRAPGQRLLTLPASEEFVRALDEGLIQIGCANRSEFIRDAIKEKLKREGVYVSRALGAQPTRFQPRVVLNDAPANKPAPRQPDPDKPFKYPRPARPKKPVDPALVKQLAGAHPLRSEVHLPTPTVVSPSDSKPEPHPPASKRPSTPLPAPIPAPK